MVGNYRRLIKMSQTTIFLALSSLFLTAVSSQLAFTWLRYQQFHCAQNTRNHHEAITQQYLCMLPQIWACMKDVIDYSQTPILLEHFCGSIDVWNTKKSDTIWTIHVKPNIHIHFLNLSLHHNYWYCDYEHLLVYSNNKTSKFCGNRLPWVHDAFDSAVEIVFSTQRFAIGSKQYLIHLQYYGAHVPNYQRFVVFIKPSPLPINMHFRSAKKYSFESVHFITRHRLYIVRLAIVSACGKHQIVCHDGPGIKSPVMPFLLNQSEWICHSSTFQMMCISSRVHSNCSQVSSLSFHAVQAYEEHFDKIHRRPTYYYTYRWGRRRKVQNTRKWKLTLDQSDVRGTTKYIFSTSGPVTLIIKAIIVSSLSMLYEGYACMHGGLFILEKYSDSGMWSHCAQNDPTTDLTIKLTRASYIVILHYADYTASRIVFEAYYITSHNWRSPPEPVSVDGDTLTLL